MSIITQKLADVLRAVLPYAENESAAIHELADDGDEHASDECTAAASAIESATSALAAYDTAQTTKGTVKSNRAWREECALLRDALGRLTGGLRLRYLAGGPQGSFFTNDLQLARDLVNLYDKDDDWTITDLENPYGPSDNGS